MANSRLDYNPPIPLVRELMREYAQQLGIDLYFQNFEQELADLPGGYAPPKGCLIIAFSGNQPAGCGAFRPFTGDVCEMKRLFVRPAYLGCGLGRCIAKALMESAEDAGYRSMRLDTLSSMKSAISLYRSLGFRETEPYYRNPIPDCLFFEATLRSANL